MKITITKLNYKRGAEFIVNSVEEFLKLINASNHVYYIDNNTHIAPDTFEKDVEAYNKYKDCMWVANDCDYTGRTFDNIDITIEGDIEYAKYGVVTVNKTTLPPIDNYIFESYEDLVYFLHGDDYLMAEIPNYEGQFDHFLTKHYKSINLRSNTIFLIKDH